MHGVGCADTAGDNASYPVPETALYRDDIIESFNTDMPFDQFVQEQPAGDLLAGEASAERSSDLVTATGFLASSRRYGTAPCELWHLTFVMLLHGALHGLAHTGRTVGYHGPDASQGRNFLCGCSATS